MLNKRESISVFNIPFNSTRKRATSAVKNPRLGNKVSVFCKGGPDVVLEFCDSIINAEGEEDDLTPEMKKDILNNIVKNYARKSYRTILVAHSSYSDTEWKNLASQNNDFATEDDKATVEAGLTLVGIFALQDPLRDGVPAAVDQCHKSGIMVRMCTGDIIDTAVAISKEAHIIPESVDPEKGGYTCMTGKDFREAIGGLINEETDEKDDDGNPITIDKVAKQDVFDRITADLRVLARSTPEDKYLLVTGLRAQGKVVAVTGDGTNDAPALSKADVGFAMGDENASKVARKASDIVLMDDNFCSILTAIKYGRNVYDNVKKFLQFQLTVNVVALFIVFAGSVIFAEETLTSVQMLWVNLIMDTFAALALATEPPKPSLLDRSPQSRTEHIVDKQMWRVIIGQSIYQVAWLLVILLAGKDIFNLPFNSDTEFITSNAQIGNTAQFEYECNKTALYTIVFQAFVFMQVFNQINCRKLGQDLNIFADFFNNWLFIGIVTFTFVV